MANPHASVHAHVERPGGYSRHRYSWLVPCRVPRIKEPSSHMAPLALSPFLSLSPRTPRFSVMALCTLIIPATWKQCTPACVHVGGHARDVIESGYRWRSAAAP